MTGYTEYTRTANAAAAEALRQTTDIKLATTEVLKSLTSLLVPLSVSMLPKSEEFVPAIDTVVDRSFDVIVKLVEWQYELGAAAVNQLSSAAASN
jgi:phage-related minor tail protein